MLCQKCSDIVKTAADVLACGYCKGDGTANEIPKDMPAESLLEAVLERKPALGNRFVAPAPKETKPRAKPKASAKERAKKSRR